MYNNCSIVKIICNVPFPWYIQAAIQLHYRTPQNSKSAFSVETFQIPNANWTPVLINKIWYYKMHHDSSQVASEQIQLCISDAQAFQLTICSMLLQTSSYVLQVLFWAQLRPGWPAAVFKGLGESQGLVIHFYTWTKPTNKVINLIALTFT